MYKLRQRLDRQEGFTLIELLVVIVILGILMAIAVPSYLGFQKSANKRAAESDLRAAIPSAAAYYNDNSKYSGMTTAILTSTYDANLKATVVSAVDAPAPKYCLTQSVGGQAYSVSGPATLWYSNNNCSGAGSTTAP